MSEFLNQKYNRRDFLSSLGRYLILGGLALTAGTVIVKRKSASVEEGFTDLEICQKCRFLRKCDQPGALLVRKEMSKF